MSEPINWRSLSWPDWLTLAEQVGPIAPTGQPLPDSTFDAIADEVDTERFSQTLLEDWQEKVASKFRGILEATPTNETTD